jgi:hypothetical protein
MHLERFNPLPFEVGFGLQAPVGSIKWPTSAPSNSSVLLACITVPPSNAPSSLRSVSPVPSRVIFGHARPTDHQILSIDGLHSVLRSGVLLAVDGRFVCSCDRGYKCIGILGFVSGEVAGGS